MNKLKERDMFKKFSGWASIVSISLTLLLSPLAVSADSASGLALLQSRQQADGSISDGYSSPSQWAAIAFAAYGISANNVKNPSVSLYDYLLSDIGSGSATDNQTRILAIHAVGGDASNFGGTNYLANLEAQHNGGQLGDPTLLNDDMFGLLALIAAGNSASASIKQDVLNYIIAHQAPSGAFSYCADYTAQWCDPSADLTGAALQALQVAKDDGLSAAGHDAAIANALSYLQSNQNADGGFGYFGSSDADSTAWVLMALNVAEPGTSMQASAKAWLESSQQPDGSFPAFSGNSTTTAHALIALSGNGWLVQNPGSATPGTPVIGGRGAVGSANASTTQAMTIRANEFNETFASTEEGAQGISPAQKAADELANSAKTGGKVAAAEANDTQSFITRWRWLLAVASACSLLGASIYFFGYNKGTK